MSQETTTSMCAKPLEEDDFRARGHKFNVKSEIEMGPGSNYSQGDVITAEQVTINKYSKEPDSAKHVEVCPVCNVKGSFDFFHPVVKEIVTYVANKTIYHKEKKIYDFFKVSLPNKLTEGKVDCRNLNFYQQNLSHLDLSYALFNGSILVGANLKCSRLYETDLENANITYVKNLTPENLSEAKFSNILICNEDIVTNDIFKKAIKIRMERIDWASKVFREIESLDDNALCKLQLALDDPLFRNKSRSSKEEGGVAKNVYECLTEEQKVSLEASIGFFKDELSKKGISEESFYKTIDAAIKARSKSSITKTINYNNVSGLTFFPPPPFFDLEKNDKNEILELLNGSYSDPVMPRKSYVKVVNLDEKYSYKKWGRIKKDRKLDNVYITNFVMPKVSKKTPQIDVFYLAPRTDQDYWFKR